MESQLSIFIAIILGFIVILFFLNKKLSDLQKNKPDTMLLEWLKTMQSSIDSSSTHMVKTLQENSKQLNQRLDTAATVIRDVGKEVGQMSEIGRSMKELQDFLKSPKLRGNIGEQVLKDLISQMFPKNSFHIQYQFKSGERVDAAIQTDAGILPIDSKFPMENFQKMSKAENKLDKSLFEKEFGKDIKKHITDIAKKYILPEEGTMDFALMYVPSESVYYELVNMLDIMDFAKQSRVYVVSPTTLYAHLQTILLAFEGKKIESKSRDLFKMLRALQVDYNKVEENMVVLGKHINNASSQFNNVNTSINQIGQKIDSTKSLEA
ncbi:MAG: DNA recombination protein RmuC [Candidatus Levybacteria bacterium]|nr:DNA recombination protein RmuC [Candidatus Levybacteria bacterium]MDZ4227707.1 DNA recombination protein RmuC [Candidatus Levybacteria bacterium]